MRVDSARFGSRASTRGDSFWVCLQIRFGKEEREFCVRPTEMMLRKLEMLPVSKPMFDQNWGEWHEVFFLLLLQDKEKRHMFSPSVPFIYNAMATILEWFSSTILARNFGKTRNCTCHRVRKTGGRVGERGERTLRRRDQRNLTWQAKYDLFVV